MTRLSTSLFALLAAAPLAATAQDAIPTLDEIVVTAQLEDTSAERTGATVDVVSQEDIAASAATRVTDYLSRLPGVTVTTRGSIGTQTGIALRGASQNYVSVLVDGIDVTDPSGTQVAYDFGQMTTAGVGRIEVLKGSQSALYGSRAVGGVIAIDSPKPTEDGTVQQAEAEVGSFATRKLGYSVAHKSGPLEAQASLSHFRTDGFSAADEENGNTEDDGFESARLSFGLAWRPDAATAFGVNGFAERSTGEYDEQFPALADGSPDEVLKRRAVGLRAFGDFATGNVDNHVEAAIFDSHRDYTESAGGFAADYGYQGTRQSVKWQSGLDVGAAGRLVLGADWSKEIYDQTGDYGLLKADAKNTGVYSELTWALSDTLDVSATLRHDDHSVAGGATTGRLAFAWRVTPDTTIRGQAGTGFRAPSNFELFSFYGATTLKAETSRNADLGIEHRYGDTGMVRATVFTLAVEDLIDYDFAGTACDSFAVTGFPGCYNQIDGVSKRKGIELEGQYALTDTVTLGGTYTYTDSETNASSAWGQMAKHVVGLNLGVEVTEAISTEFSVEHQADRATLPDFTVANATATYDFGNETEAYLRVENLFNEQYQTAEGYGTSDRALYVGVRAKF